MRAHRIEKALMRAEQAEAIAETRLRWCERALAMARTAAVSCRAQARSLREVAPPGRGDDSLLWQKRVETAAEHLDRLADRYERLYARLRERTARRRAEAEAAAATRGSCELRRETLTQTVAEERAYLLRREGEEAALSRFLREAS
jgi:hypothetical protein